MAQSAGSDPQMAGEPVAPVPSEPASEPAQQQEGGTAPASVDVAGAPSPATSATATPSTQPQEPQGANSAEANPDTEQQPAQKQLEKQEQAEEDEGEATPPTLHSEPSTPIPRKRDALQGETVDGQPPAKKRKLDNGSEADPAASSPKTSEADKAKAPAAAPAASAPDSRVLREQSNHDVEEVLRGLDPTADNVAAILKRLSRDELAHLVGRCVEKHPTLLRFVAEQAHVERENSRKVFVRQISFGASESDLEQAFSQFGPVESARLALNSRRESKGFGFVTFRTVQASAEALKARTLDVSGRTCIIVAYDESEKPARRHPRGDRYSDRGGGGDRDYHHRGDRGSDRPRSLPMQRDRHYDSRDRGADRGRSSRGYEADYSHHRSGGGSSSRGDYDDRGGSSSAAGPYDPYGASRGGGGGQYYDERAAAAAAAAANAYYQQGAPPAHGYDPSGGYGAPPSGYGREGYY